MTYLEHYESYVEPKLQEIDVFIKSQDPITIESIVNLLSLSEFEVHKIIKENNITLLNKMTFFVIMKNGSSPICQLFNRELERGAFSSYTFDDISYIYNIPYEKVINAADKLDIDFITQTNIRIIFSNIKL